MTYPTALSGVEAAADMCVAEFPVVRGRVPLSGVEAAADMCVAEFPVAEFPGRVPRSAEFPDLRCF